MKKLLCCVALLLTPWPAHADFIIGPGDIPAFSAAGSGDTIDVDLTAPATLGPGTYVASWFNYVFRDGGGADFLVTGQVTPLLLVAAQPDFSDVRPVAIGSTITYTGATAFISAPFGGADTFTLAAGTTVYGGFYWHATPLPGVDERAPIPYLDGVGSTLGRFSGAGPPVIGTPISSPAVGIGQESFAFSVTVNPAAPVPEPPALLLALTGGVGLFGWGWLRRKGDFACVRAGARETAAPPRQRGRS